MSRFDGTAPAIVAHRGASFDAPENTASSIRLAWEMGADAIEVDLRLSADGRIIAIHDDSTGRTCGANHKVRLQTLPFLQSLDAGTWKGRRWSGERIPTLPSILECVPEGRQVVLEIKDGPEILPVLRDDLRASRIDPKQVILIGFDFEVVKLAKSMAPECGVLHLVGRSGAGLQAALDAACAAGLDGLDVGIQRRPDASLTAEAHARGKQIFVYTVNDNATARSCAAIGIDGITTDRPDRIRRLFRQPE